MEWKNAIVFISSTFNDMHAERDYLIKEVFPKLTEWCEERKIRLTDIDLRWGVSEEDSSNSKTIETCLRHVDKSRPFFLCFLGQRRGWVPNFDKDISEETKQTYDITDLEDRSATEMEIEHALLKPLHIMLNREEFQKEYPDPTRHSLFFFRNGDYTRDDSLSPYQRLIYTNEYLKVIGISDVMDELKESDNALYQKILDKLTADFKNDSLKYPQFISELVSDINSYDCGFYNKYLIEGLIENPLRHIDIIAEFKFKKQSLFKGIANEIRQKDENLYNNLLNELDRYEYKDIGINEFREEFSILDGNNSIDRIIDDFTKRNEEEFAIHEEKLQNYRTKIENRKIEEDNSSKSDSEKVHVVIEDYKGTWNNDLPLPELSHYRFGEGQGRLTNFECNGEPLRDVIINHFIEQFEMEFADHLKELEAEKNADLNEDLIEDLDQQENFRHINNEGFVPRPIYTDKLKAYVESEDDRICLVSAKGGYGKTMLLANFATEFNEFFPDTKIYSRFCGNSKLSSKSHSLWKSIIDEAGISENEDFYPHNIDELRRNIDDILLKLSQNGKTVIVIDAVNQVDDGLEMFKWLGKLPDNLKLIITAKEDSQLDMIRNSSVLSQHSFELDKLDSSKDELVETYIKNLDDYVSGDSNGLCLVTSDMNYDKSLIFTKFAQNNPDKNIIHFTCRVANSDCPSDRVNNSVREITGKAEDINRILNGHLSEISDDSIVIIDAFGDKNLLDVLSQINYNFKTIIGVKKSENVSGIFTNTSQYSFELEELDEEKIKIIHSYLSNYLKELDEKEIHDICNFEGAENPLYLKILLAELRVFGSFDQLKDEIKKFGTSPLSAFNQVLVRLENDEKDLKRGTNIVPLLFSLLSSARVGGLSENEIISIILGQIDPVTDNSGNDVTRKFVQDNVRLNLRQVRPFMARKEAGRQDFFYEQFRQAAEERYVDMREKSVGLLTDYFRNEADPAKDFTFKGENPRAFIELPYYLNESHETEELEKTLSSYAFIKNKLDASDIYGLIIDYQYLDLENKDDEYPLALIVRALELSAPVLMSNKDQLPNQLYGRMAEIEDGTIQKLLEDLENYNIDEKWLKSNNTALYSPKSAIIKRLRPDGKRSSTAIGFSNNDKIVFGSEDGVLNLYDINDNTFEVLEKTDSKIIKIIFNDDGTMYVARTNGNIKKWDINSKNTLEEYNIRENYPDVDITDMYCSKTYNKIYCSSHVGIYSINLETTEIKREAIENKNYNQIIVPRRNEAIFVCDDVEVDGWDVYEMRKAYNKHHQQNISDGDDIEGDFSSKSDSSGDIKFMGMVKRFLILISENGQMKIWNSLQNSGGGQSIDEQFTSSLNDQFRQAVALEDKKQVITMSKMGVLRVWNIPEPRRPMFNLDTYEPIDGEEIAQKDIQTGIVSTTSMGYYNKGDKEWIIVGNEKSDISIVDLNKQTNDIKHEKHADAVLSIDNYEGKLITVSENGEIYIWDSNVEEADKFSYGFRTNCVSFDNRSGNLISAGIKYEKDGRITNKYAVFNVSSNEIDEDSKSRRIIDLAQNNDGVVYIDETGLTVNDNTISLDGTPSTLYALLDSSDVYIGFSDGKIGCYSNGDFKSFENKNGSAVIKINIINNQLIAGHENGEISLFEMNGNHKISYKAHEDAITNFYVLNESQFISVSKDNALKIWDINLLNGISGDYGDACIYEYYTDIYITSIKVNENNLILGDTLGNVRLFNFDKFL